MTTADIVKWAEEHARGLARAADEELEKRVAALVIDPPVRRPRKPWPSAADRRPT